LSFCNFVAPFSDVALYHKGNKRTDEQNDILIH